MPLGREYKITLQHIYRGWTLTENRVNPNNICEERRAKSNEHGHCHEEHSWAVFDYERAVPEISEQNLILTSTYLLEPVFCASQSNASFTGNMRNKAQPTHASRI